MSYFLYNRTSKNYYTTLDSSTIDIGGSGGGDTTANTNINRGTKNAVSSYAIDNIHTTDGDVEDQRG